MIYMKFLKVVMCILTFAALLYMAVFFKSYYTLMAAFCVAFVIIADIVLFLMPFGVIDAEISSNKTDYIKGEKGKIYIKLKNKKIFPIYRVKFNIFFKNKFYKASKMNIETPISMLKSKIINILIDIEKSGVIGISINNIEYSDMFGILSKKIDVDVSYSVIVMPKNIDVDKAYFGTAESDEIPAVNVYLSNTGDISGYKEYGIGDRNNNINWKLFARTDKLYVREFERTSADETIVLMDMNIQKIDKAIDIVYSIGYKNGSFTLLWLPCGNEEFESAYISDEGSLNNAIYRIYDSTPEVIENKGLTEYKRLYRENKVLYVSDKMELL